MEQANGGAGEVHAMELSAAAECSNASSKEEMVAVKIDMAVLHCPLCTLPLKPPVFQCEVGHLVCGSCRAQLSDNQCRGCADGSGAYGRCPGLDVFLRGVKIQCPHDAYGCRSHVAYCDAGDHRRECPCAPCSCPEPGCTFQGSPPALLDHVHAEHGQTIILVRYGRVWDLTLPLSQRWHVFVAQEDRAVFLLSLGALGEGTAVSLVCVRPNSGGAAAPQYTCRLALGFPSGAGAGDGDGTVGAVVMESKVSSSALSGAQAAPDHGVFVHQRLLSGDTLTLSVRIDQLQPAGAGAATAAAADTAGKSTPPTPTRDRSSRKSL